jgi:MYXO-CTERM domain-containing protein
MKQKRHLAVPFLFCGCRTGGGPSVLVEAALAAMLLFFGFL